jgi:integrase
LAAIDGLPRGQALFTLTLFWTGARPAEVLALRRSDFQPSAGVVAIRTLKRRRLSIREVPLPPAVMAAIGRHFGFADGAGESALLWPWSRSTAWRLVKRLMAAAGIAGARASPRGLRHGFAIAALQAGVPVTLLQRWLGHSRLSTTAIYAAAVGPEERAFAARLWRMAA